MPDSVLKGEFRKDEVAPLQTVTLVPMVVSPTTDVAAEVSELRQRLDRLADAMEDAIASIEIAVVKGYLVKLWQDVESGEWICDCPTVKCVAQEATRDEALQGIDHLIGRMLRLLERHTEVPPRDVPATA